MPMTFWGIRVPPQLEDRVLAEAERRGMNLSEFVRYALNSFFDNLDDNGRHFDDRLLVDPPVDYTANTSR